MNVVQQVINWLGIDLHSSPRPADKAIRNLIEAGQHAKRAEKYDLALELFGQAAKQADTAHDLTATAVIILHRAELYILKQDWEDAQNLLLQMRRTAQNTGQRTHMVYALCGLGTLAQAQGDWDDARGYYEQALKIGRSTTNTGGEARALGHLADTYLEENNASYALHLLQEAVPKLNISGDIELSSYFVGQLAQALIASGQETEGERLLYRALRLAEQMNHRAYERRWSLALGQRMLTTMRYDEAFKHYERALALLGSGGTLDEKVAALADMSRVCLYLFRNDQALEYAQQAVGLADHQSDKRLDALAHGALGMTLRLKEESLEAIKNLTHATDYYAQTDAAPNIIYVETLRNLAAAQVDIGDVETALATYQRTLEIARKLDNPLELAQTQVDLGLLHHQRREMQAAIDQWSAAQALYNEEHLYAQVARLACDIAGARKYLGQGQRAIKDYENALTILSSIDDWSTRGLVVSNAAVAYTDLGEIESAEAFFSEAITIASRLGDRSAEAIRRGNYGWFLLSTARPHQALATLDHALRISEQINDELQIAVQTSNLGLAHDLLANQSAALTYHEQAYALSHTLRDFHWRGMLHLNYAQALIQRGRADETLSLLDNVLAFARQQGDTELLIRTLTIQGQIMLLHHQPEEAGKILLETVNLARRADMRRLLAHALHIYSQQQSATGQLQQAQQTWDEAQRLYTVLRATDASLQPDWLTATTPQSH